MIVPVERAVIDPSILALTVPRGFKREWIFVFVSQTKIFI